MKCFYPLFFSLLLFCFGLQAQQSNVTSVLEIVDTRDGRRTPVKEFPFLIEAPNWTPDGKWLIYNSGGRLYKIAAEEPGEPIAIETDFAIRCNNDHVVTFDGQQIALSHEAEGGSRIYTVPIDGGIPRLITEQAPSYLHGWSPDNRYLTYCAERNGNYDVYTIPADGGEEIRLTTADGLDDGPEYAPCGEMIWFNSVRSGLMQIWRMRADGSEQQQMTFDETRNSWFPHVSPDGEQVLFIAYKKGDVAPGDHPANKSVELLLISSSGGEPTVVASLFGGQGSLNVNSWAPDSRRAAFVSYRLNP